MLNTCCQFANDYKLLFNPGKTQLPISPTFLFAGQSLKLANRACHLGHILRSVLSDTDDILRVQLICAIELTAFYLLFMPLILLSRPSYFALSVFLSIWFCAMEIFIFQLRPLEVTFNNLLGKIWKLPRHCHTSILHCIGSLQSLF